MRWPFVWRKTYEALMDDYQRHEHHYWKQAAHNGMWERKCDKLEKEIARLKSIDPPA